MSECSACDLLSGVLEINFLQRLTLITFARLVSRVLVLRPGLSQCTETIVVTVTYSIFPLDDAVLFTTVTQQWSLYSMRRALLKQRNSQHKTEIQQERTL